MIDYLVKMYLEQNSNGMHREAQRATATTIFTSLATALLAIIGSRWKPGTPFDESYLPLTVGLSIFSLAGAFLVMKILERSQVNFVLADAYRHTADFILTDEVETLVNGNAASIKYVARAYDYVADPDNPLPFKVTFHGGRKTVAAMGPDEYRAILASHNPIDPREVVIPRHNASATWNGIKWVSFDTHNAWTHIHLIYFFIGVGLSIMAAA